MSLLSEDHIPFRLPPVGTPEETDLFSFDGSVGPNGENRREDVIKAQTLLQQTGDYDPEKIFKVPTGWPSGDLWRGIKAFQKRHGKQPDGTLLPVPVGGVDENGVGESVQALRGELGEQLAGQRARTPSQVDAHYENEARLRNTVADEAAPPPQRPVQWAQADMPKLGLSVRDAAVQSDAPTAAAIPQPPAHKKDVFARTENKNAWEGHHKALQQQLPDHPVLRGALGRLYAEEGGRTPDPKSGAVGGILPDTLDDLRRRGKLSDLSPDLKPHDLTPEQQARVQHAYFDDVLHTVGGAKALEDLPQGMADAIADTLYLDGRGTGTGFLQAAINIAAGSDLVAADGRMGPQTWSTLRRIAADRDARDAWLDAAAEARIEGKARSPGELDRISRLRSKRNR